MRRKLDHFFPKKPVFWASRHNQGSPPLPTRPFTFSLEAYLVLGPQPNSSNLFPTIWSLYMGTRSQLPVGLQYPLSRWIMRSCLCCGLRLLQSLRIADSKCNYRFCCSIHNRIMDESKKHERWNQWVVEGYWRRFIRWRNELVTWWIWFSFLDWGTEGRSGKGCEGIGLVFDACKNGLVPWSRKWGKCFGDHELPNWGSWVIELRQHVWVNFILGHNCKGSNVKKSQGWYYFSFLHAYSMEGRTKMFSKNKRFGR